MTEKKIRNLETAALAHSKWVTSIVLLILTLAMFWDVLFLPGDQVLSHLGEDLSREFVYWRQFGFHELGAGHLALWNPHVFSGVPFLGGFQAALLYPPNLIYLVLPLAKAINCEIALHVFLLGLFMSIWARYHRFHPAAVLLTSVSVMFGGAFFLHIYPGHLATLDAMAWAPLILVVLDGLIDDPRPEWIFAGIIAFAMELLAGHPQTLFNLLVTCSLYGVVRLHHSPRFRRTILSIGIVGAGAIALTAVQLWTGQQAASEGTRHGGVSYVFASELPFPFWNFLTLIVPAYFGNLTQLPYWRVDLFWEVCPFFGIAGVSMAILALFGKSPLRFVWVAMAVILFWIALANNTPLFPILFRFVPGFDHFRSHSKFIFEAVLFLAMLAGAGMDGLLQTAHGAKVGAWLLIFGAVTIGVVGLCLRYDISLGGIIPTFASPSGEAETTTFPAEQASPNHTESDTAGSVDFNLQAAYFSGYQCLRSSVIMLALSAILWFRRYNSRVAYLLLVVGIGEMFAFAHSTLITFPLAQTIPTTTQQLLAGYPGDYRILHLPDESNSAMLIGAEDIWGYDPMVLKRYAQLIAYSQGANPDDASMYAMFMRFGPLLRLTRLHLIIMPGRNNLRVVENFGALPHVLLANEWSRMTGRDQILRTLSSESFDPTRTVILESDPEPKPQLGLVDGSAQILNSESDSMIISARVAKPSLLLITDAYSRFWRAVALPRSSQTSYQVLPADYAFMAIPLAAGSHLIRLEYRPSGYTIGRWISLVGLAVFLLAFGEFVRRKRNAQPA